MELTKKSLQETTSSTWSDLLAALKHSQDSLAHAPSRDDIVKKCSDSLVRRLAMSASDASPCFRVSCDSNSTESLRVSWWFDDLLFLNPTSLQTLTKSMISIKFDPTVLTMFLFHYLNSKPRASTTLEAVVDTLELLGPGSASCKGLFGALRAARRLRVDRRCVKKIEAMIGSRMDRARLDDVLVPSPCGTSGLYDVSLVLRFVKAFLRDADGSESWRRMRRVGGLMDLYIAEVAPDRGLKHYKFVALVRALPDCCRESHEGLYRAIDMYLKAHRELSEEQKIEICSALNYEKLSAETRKHISKNPDFTQKDDRIVDDSEKLEANLQGMQWRVMELEIVCRKMQTQMAKVMKSRDSNHKSSRSLPKLCS